MSKWPLTAERYVAFIDIMGFRSLLKSKSAERMYRIMRALHDRARLAEDQAKGMVGASDTGTPKFTRGATGTSFIQVAQFSDSIVAFTRDTSALSSISIRLAAMGFLIESLSTRVPMRGAIARGQCATDFAHSIFFGQPIVDAYELAEDQQWYGVAEHDNCEPKAKENFSLREIQSNEVSLSEPHYVPLKSGNRDLCVLNWPVFMESKVAIEQVLSPFINKESAKLHMYYRHTRDFALNSWRKYHSSR